MLDEAVIFRVRLGKTLISLAAAQSLRENGSTARLYGSKSFTRLMALMPASSTSADQDEVSSQPTPSRKEMVMVEFCACLLQSIEILENGSIFGPQVICARLLYVHPLTHWESKHSSSAEASSGPMKKLPNKAKFLFAI